MPDVSQKKMTTTRSSIINISNKQCYVRQ